MSGIGLAAIFLRQDLRRQKANEASEDEVSKVHDMFTTLIAEKMENAPLRRVIQGGFIRLLKISWLRQEFHDGWTIPRMQDLPPNAFFYPTDAIKLLDKGDRSIIVLSYPWLSAGHPDPMGERTARVAHDQACMCAIGTESKHDTC